MLQCDNYSGHTVKLMYHQQVIAQLALHSPIIIMRVRLWVHETLDTCVTYQQTVMKLGQ